MIRVVTREDKKRISPDECTQDDVIAFKYEGVIYKLARIDNGYIFVSLNDSIGWFGCLNFDFQVTVLSAIKWSSDIQVFAFKDQKELAEWIVRESG